MTNIWTYDMGLWKEATYEDAGLDDWKEGLEFGGFLADNQFFDYASFSFGNTGYNSLNFYKHKTDEKWFCDADIDQIGVYFFIIPNFPSMMLFQKEYSDVYKVNLPEYVLCDDGEYLKREKIVTIRTRGSRQKDSNIKVIGFLEGDNDGIVLVDSHRNYVSEFFKNNLGIDF